MLRHLVEDGKITAEQAQLARLVPMADDVTVEADSGGHTDNRPLVSLVPSIIRLRDELQEKYHLLKRCASVQQVAFPPRHLPWRLL